MNISPMMKFKLFQFASKYGVQVHHYEPGFIEVFILNWRKYEDQLRQLIDKMTYYPEIKTIEFIETHNLLSIQYDDSMFKHQSDIEYWFNLLENELT